MKKLSLTAQASLLAVSVALLSPLAVQAQNLAVVNGKPVPKARAEALMEQALAPKQGAQPVTRTPELEAQVRDEVVLREMFMQEAEKRGLTASPAYKAQIELARQGILIRDLFADFSKKNPVTDAEIKAEYERYKKQAGDTEYHARHIVVDKEEEAKALLAQLKNGAKFEELAKANSKDPGSAENGGDLEWVNPSSFVPEFAKALLALKKGETTQTPVKSQFGYHIIKLEDTRKATVPTMEELKDQIQQRLAQVKLTKFRDEIKAKAKTDYKFSATTSAKK